MKTKKVLRVSRSETGLDPVLRRRILETSRGLFLRYGFSRITVDEISSDLGISKATLYKFFKRKEDLLASVIDSIKAEILGGVEEILADKKAGCLEKLVRLMTYLGHWLSRIGPFLTKDLYRRAPGVWEDVERFRKEKISVNFRGIIEAGAREGVFKNDIDRELIVQMYLSLVQNFLNPEALLSSSSRAQDIFETIIRIFFEGILTDKSRPDFQDKKKSFSQSSQEVA